MGNQELWMSMMARQDLPGGLFLLAILGLLITKIAWSIYRLLDPNKLNYFTAEITRVSIKVGDCDIPPLKHVRNLGTWFDNHMSMNTHIGKVCSKAFRGLYNIRQIRKYLSAESTKCLIHAFVTSHLDYCNALLYKLPQYQYDRLQKVLNAAARVTCLIPKFAHITPVLRELHWLPLKFRVEFKIALFSF